MSAPHHRLALVAALFVFVSYGYFAQGGSANPNSRYNLTRSIVERGALNVDPYHTNTIDKSFHDGHHYCDKAPGLSLVAVPVYAVTVARADAQSPSPEPDSEALYLLTVGTVSLVSAVAAAFMLLLLVRLGVHPLIGLAAVALWTVGTNAFAYGATFVGHQFVASLLTIALYCLERAFPTLPRDDHDDTHAPWWLTAAGALLGYTVVSEYPAALIVCGVGLYALWRLIQARRWSWMPWFILPGLLPGFGLMVYNAVCFGGPLQLSYTRLVGVEVFQEGIEQGVFGISLPRPVAVWELLFGEFRGLLPLSPAYLLAPFGWIALLRDPDRRPMGALTLGLCLMFLGVIGGFAFWHGGAAMGPRMLVPTLPFATVAVAVALQRLWDWAPTSGGLKALRASSLGASALLIAASIAICTMCVAVFPDFPESEQVMIPGQARPVTRTIPPGSTEIPFQVVDKPFRNIIWPLFQADLLSQKVVERGSVGLESQLGTPGHRWDAFNLGELLGLKGRASLIPLLVFWILSAIAAVVLWRRGEDPGQPSPSDDR